MSAPVDSFFDEYARRYTERDAEGVTNLCLWPFVAIRRGEAIHLADRDAVRDHFASAIAAYRFAAGAGKWTPVEIDARQLGEHSVFATARRRRARGPRHLDELPTGRDSRRVALSLVHESLLELARRILSSPGRDRGSSPLLGCGVPHRLGELPAVTAQVFEHA